VRKKIIQLFKQDHSDNGEILFADLTNSECNKKIQITTGEWFKEGININKGLLASSNVILQLGDGTYIEYKDSIFTRLLGW